MNYPSQLTQLHRWVNANNGSKCPIDGFSLRAASVSDPRTWSDFPQVVHNVETGYCDYIGFMFAGDGIVGIDVDTGYDEEGFMSELACDIIRTCESYTERSKSGRGFHILLQGRLPFDGMNNQHGVEIYENRRFFIMTGDVVVFDKLIENQAAIDKVLTKYFASEQRPDNKRYRERQYTPRWKPPQNGRFYLKAQYPRIPQGCRNTSLLSLGGALLNEGLTDLQILKEMQVCNRMACEPPLADDEVCAVWHSVLKYRK